jgi:hypothetical protein
LYRLKIWTDIPCEAFAIDYLDFRCITQKQANDGLVILIECLQLLISSMMDFLPQVLLLPIQLWIRAEVFDFFERLEEIKFVIAD